MGNQPVPPLRGPWASQGGWGMGQGGSGSDVLGNRPDAQSNENVIQVSRFKEKLPTVKSVSPTFAADVVYTVERAESLGKKYSHDSVFSALERALPPSIIRRHNRAGDMSLMQICTKLKEVYNSPLLLYDEARVLEMVRLDNKENLAEDIMSFVHKVEDFNLRCVSAGGLYVDLSWNMSRVLDHVNGE